MVLGKLRGVPPPQRDVSRRNQLGTLDGIVVHRGLALNLMSVSLSLEAGVTEDPQGIRALGR